jgi:hypothetical protein
LYATVPLDTLCSGTGKFRQKSRIVGVDEQQVIAQSQQYGLHYPEICLKDELRPRFPLPAIQVTPRLMVRRA